ncbi:hydroxypyruvate isomerase family protein [Diplocloster agilis]|uniref:hydroxypyruvate isomerase family protein n=1 Tax=Diplocloster agilis TaxID=2850323 RepID=UPI000821D714|nr:TIM barrel protein [Suonthocola fibrivorans]MCU6732330.1 TIM barrel protein [Suonthocola fibrivorans]SCI43568.1 Hydroxypyruvate isomerase [uncultured Clostridium sp.]
MKYSLCIEPVFGHLPFYDRVRAARECGADAVEFWNPFVYDPGRLAAVLEREHMQAAACGLGDNWKYRLNLPFPVLKNELERAIAFGREIGCYTFIGLSGDRTSDSDTQMYAIIENLKRLAQICEREDVTIVLEALNSRYDHKGYFLDRASSGFDIIKAVDSPHVKLLYDCYHMQIMEGDVVNSIRQNCGLIGHFHSAGVPGRHEPSCGELYYPAVIKEIEACGYEGYFGLEYWPSCEDGRSVREVLKYLRANSGPGYSGQNTDDEDRIREGG